MKKKSFIVAAILTLGGLTAYCAVRAVAPAAPIGAGGAVAAVSHPLRNLLLANLGRLMTLRADLNVTDDQKTRIREVLQAHRAEILPVVTNLVEKRRALREAVRAEQPDEAQIRARAEALGKAIGDAAVLAAGVIPEVGTVLTPQQTERIDRFIRDKDESVDNVLEEMNE